jgi:hypothetical protein
MHLIAVDARIKTHDADGAGVGRPQSNDALDRRGLARTVRTEDAEDLALFDRERDVIDRDSPRVRLTKALDNESLTGVATGLCMGRCS